MILVDDRDIEGNGACKGILKEALTKTSKNLNVGGKNGKVSLVTSRTVG